MNNEKNLIPDYRFSEFENDESWKLHPIADKLDYERPDKYIVKDTNYIGEGTPVLTANKSFILGYTSENEGVYNNNLPVIIFDDFTVDNKFIDFPFKVKSSAIKILKNKNNKDSLKFIFELMSQIKFEAKEHKRYYISSYQNIEIPFPINPAEQQKIAACLSSLDDVIEGHEEKLNALEEHKKGLMQNLFPQDGETVPKFRFSEFETDGEWVVKKLDEVADFFKGKGISKSDIVEGGLISCIRYGELYTTYGETIFKVKSKTNIDKSELFFSKKNDVIIPSSGETQIDIATASCVMLDNIALGGDLNVIRTEINGVFLSYQLNYSQKLEIAKMAQGNAVVHLYNYQLASLSIKYPSPSEQQKIAEVLTSVDELIVAQREKIDALKEHKKGLLQGLFPKIEI